MADDDSSAILPLVRGPRAEDRDGIAALLAELGYPASPGAVEARLAELTTHPGTAVFVADLHNQPMGVATAYVVPVVHADWPVAVLSALVVHEGHRRRGIGRQLVEAAHQWARDRHAYRITVSSGLARAAAHAFYEGLGYEHTARRYSRLLW